jgi:hypothetical protein
MANTTIELRQSGSTGNTPSLGVLANGELAINRADGILYYKSASNTLGSIRTTQPAGLTTEVQFNDAGSFGSTSQVTVNKTSGLLTATLLKSSQSSGDEGGQIDLATAATNSSLAGGSVAIDIYQNRLRIFETGGTNRGVYIDMANSAAAGVGTDLTSPAAIDSYARSKANSANITADAAYAWANTVNVFTQSAFSRANTANITADAAFGRANSANVLAQAAFDKANSVTQQGFVTVAANGTSVVADANNDTLTLTAATANGIQILANATSDTIDFGLKPSGVTSGTYGNTSTAVTITIDQFGRITSVSQTAITYTETDPLALAYAIALG